METNPSSLYQEHENILDEIGPHLVLASKGKRFLNFIIDGILFRIILFIFYMLIGILAQDVLVQFILGGSFNVISLYLFQYLCYALFMAISEKIGKGASLGKKLTGTCAVTEDGDVPNWTTCFQRGFYRLIPFEVFSGLTGYTWHDQLSNTYVIDLGKSRL